MQSARSARYTLNTKKDARLRDIIDLPPPVNYGPIRFSFLFWFCLIFFFVVIRSCSFCQIFVHLIFMFFTYILVSRFAFLFSFRRSEFAMLSPLLMLLFLYFSILCRPQTSEQIPIVDISYFLCSKSRSLN